jgi:hypothetical protein
MLTLQQHDETLSRYLEDKQRFDLLAIYEMKNKDYDRAFEIQRKDAISRVALKDKEVCCIIDICSTHFEASFEFIQVMLLGIGKNAGRRGNGW